LETGEEAEAVAFDGNLLKLRSPRAFAPGAPIRFKTTEDEPRSLEGRTIGSKRVDDRCFEIRMRFVNLRRNDRELLLRKLA
jgi:hypothetical protein